MRKKTLIRIQNVGLMILIVSGCASPSSSTPPATADAQYPEVFAESEASPVSPEFAETQWWVRLGDEEMEGLIRRALDRNPSLEAADARVRAARHLIGTEQARLRPQISASGAYTRTDLSENLPILSGFMEQGLVQTDQELFSAGFDAAWEIDVFGGARKQVEAAEAGAEAADAVLRDAQLRMVAEVARTYFQLRNRQRGTELLTESIELSESLAALARNRLRTGVGMESAVAEAKSRTSILKSRLPQSRAAVDASIYRLSVLCDEPSEDLRERLSRYVAPSSPPDLVPTGLSGSLLRRRPDVRRAEARLAAATAGSEARVAELYPKFLLTGFAGRQAETFTDLKDPESTGWLIAPTVQWNLYQGGGLRSGIEAAQAERDAAEAAYQDVVMRAVGEAETRLSFYAAAFDSRDRTEDLVRQRQRGLRVAQKGYEAGVADEEAVLKASLALVEAQSQLDQACTRVLTSLAALNKALGGGWTFPETASDS
jgi:NodT family efflux transporter outer membrane factor (OMF) lipoprotein